MKTIYNIEKNMEIGHKVTMHVFGWIKYYAWSIYIETHNCD